MADVGGECLLEGHEQLFRKRSGMAGAFEVGDDFLLAGYMLHGLRDMVIRQGEFGWVVTHASCIRLFRTQRNALPRRRERQ